MSRPRLLPLLPIHVLKRAGMFNGYDTWFAKRAPGKFILKLRLPGLKGVVVNDGRDAVNVELLVGGRKIRANIWLLEKHQTYGIRRYFACPECGGATIFLAVVAWGLRCPGCLYDLDDYLTPGQRRTMMIRAKEGVRGWKPDKSNAKPARKPVPAPDPLTIRMSTETGLARGQEAGHHEIVHQYLAGNIDPSDLPNEPDDVPAESVGRIAAFPELDVNVLLRHIPQWGEALVARMLRWEDGDGTIHAPFLVFDGSGAGRFILVGHKSDPAAQPTWQTLRIKHHPNGRDRFVCPVSGVNCDRLYLRNGYFASREVQRLKHPSQFADGRVKKQR